MTKRSDKKQRGAEIERFQRQLELYRASDAFARVGHFEWNLDEGRFESCSDTFAAFFGLSAAEMLDPGNWGKLQQTLHEDDRERFVGYFENLSSSDSVDIEYRVKRGDGSLQYLFQSGVDLPGSGSLFAGVVQDVTERIEHDADFEYREAAALQTERIADIGHFVIDETEDRYIYASPGCAYIYGLSEEEYRAEVESVEEDLADVHEADRQRVHDAYMEYFETGEDCRIEFRIFRADGELRWIRELLVAMQMQADGKVALTRGVLQDITEEKNTELELREAKHNLEQTVAERTRELADTIAQLEAEIEEREKISAELDFLANHDPLTGLPSLRLCKDRLERALAEARRRRQLVAVMFVDLDGFKAINDSYGHEFGDKVLKVTASRLRAEVRETDTVARIGGDEFLIILTAIPDLSIVERIGASLVEQVSQGIIVDQHEVGVSASIGISIYPDDASDAESLIRCADKAMYRVKHSGKNHFGYLENRHLN